MYEGWGRGQGAGVQGIQTWAQISQITTDLATDLVANLPDQGYCDSSIMLGSEGSGFSKHSGLRSVASAKTRYMLH